MNKQRGGTLLGFVLGLLVGLAAALSVAVYITKVPIPFMSKVQSGGADKEAETKKNRDWDPNAGLSGKPAATPGEAPSGTAPPTAPGPAPAPATPSAPAGPQSGAAPDLLGDLAKARADAKPAAPAAAAPPAAPAPAPAAVAPAAAASSDPFQYFVQAGAFRTPEDAEQQRAKLTLMGVQARVSERDQSGRTVFRVRLGPFEKKDEADKAKERLDGSGIEAVLVRVQR